MITILAILTVFLILAVFIPLVHNDYWLFKVLEYPRLQKLVLVLLVPLNLLLKRRPEDLGEQPAGDDGEGLNAGIDRDLDEQVAAAPEEAEQHEEQPVGASGATGIHRCHLGT